MNRCFVPNKTNLLTGSLTLTKRIDQRFSLFFATQPHQEANRLFQRNKKVMPCLAYSIVSSVKRFSQGQKNNGTLKTGKTTFIHVLNFFKIDRQIILTQKHQSLDLQRGSSLLINGQLLFPIYSKIQSSIFKLL